MEKSTEPRQILVEEVDPLDSYVDEIVDGPEGEPSDEAEAKEPTEPKEEEAEEVEEAESTETEEPEYLEFKYKGQKVKKSLDEVLDLAEKGMGADLKFQEAAEIRKATEREAARLHELANFQQATQQEHTMLAAMDMQLKQYNEIDWAGYVDQDPITAQKEWQKFQMLERQRDRLSSDLGNRYAYLQQQQTEGARRKIAEGLQQLQNELGTEWNEETKKAILTTGTSKYGFSDEELATVADPRMVKVLLDAHKWQQLQSSKVQTLKKVSEAPKMAKPGSKPVGDQTQRKTLQKMLKSTNRLSREKAAMGLLDDFIK